MKNKKRTIIIVITALVLAGAGFGVGMMARSSMASQGNISIEEAKNIALSNVGVSEGKATFTKAMLDDDGHYEIDFYTDSTKYDFEISAVNGSILEKESEMRKISQAKDTVHNEQPPAEQDSQPVSGSSGDSSVIGVEAAKQAALNHAGVSSASFIKASLDHDDGLRTYDIEFTAGGIEYDYEINAYDGSVIDFDRDVIDFDD